MHCAGDKVASNILFSINSPVWMVCVALFAVRLPLPPHTHPALPCPASSSSSHPGPFLCHLSCARPCFFLFSWRICIWAWWRDPHRPICCHALCVDSDGIHCLAEHSSASSSVVLVRREVTAWGVAGVHPCMRFLPGLHHARHGSPPPPSHSSPSLRAPNSQTRNLPCQSHS